jgi:FtsP/CotA-like multicopper oxidase with cupredoxin domain
LNFLIQRPRESIAMIVDLKIWQRHITLSLLRRSTAEIDFIANDPGPTFFHCHHQDHMDEGFAGLIVYA